MWSFLSRFKFFMLISVSLLSGLLAQATSLPQDPFLWLEEIRSARSIDWVTQRNETTLQRLQSHPLYSSFEAEARAIFTAKDRIPGIRKIRDQVYNFWQDSIHVQGILRRTTLQDYESVNPQWETVLDIDQLSKADGKVWVYKGLDCLAPQYFRCLVSLSDGGKDAVSIREFDLRTKSFVTDGFKLAESKLSIAWIDENRILVATDFGNGSMTSSGYPRQARILKRGETLEQAQLVFEGKVQDTGVYVSSALGNSLGVITRMLDFFSREIYVLAPGRPLVRWEAPSDAQLLGLTSGWAFYSSLKDWVLPTGALAPKGSLLAVPWSDDLGLELGRAQIAWRPTARSSLQGISITRDFAIVNLREDVRSQAYRLERQPGAFQSWTLVPVGLPRNGLISFGAIFEAENQGIFTYQDFLTPATTYLVDYASLEIRKLKSSPERFDSSGLTVEQRFAKSTDGVEIPYFLIRSKTLKFDGSNPAILYGYGGFMVPVTPYYLGATGKLWLERGGVYVIANIRGGGEYGPAWHEAARREKRQTAFNDFYAVAEDLILRRVTSPRHLGIEGASNGGLLVGVAFTQRPDLFNAVSCSVPLLDMLRYHLLLAGASWVGEYGNPDLPADRAFLQKYSPYQNLRPRVKYPEIFFSGSTADDRVHPGHARKMAAKLESMKLPFYFYENTEGGHGGAANLEQRIRIQALQSAYFAGKLGLK